MKKVTRLGCNSDNCTSAFSSVIILSICSRNALCVLPSLSQKILARRVCSGSRFNKINNFIVTVWWWRIEGSILHCHCYGLAPWWSSRFLPTIAFVPQMHMSAWWKGKLVSISMKTVLTSPGVQGANIENHWFRAWTSTESQLHHLLATSMTLCNYPDSKPDNHTIPHEYRPPKSTKCWTFAFLS